MQPAFDVIEAVPCGVGVVIAASGEGGHREADREVLIGLAGDVTALVIVGGEEMVEAAPSAMKMMTFLGGWLKATKLPRGLAVVVQPTTKTAIKTYARFLNLIFIPCEVIITLGNSFSKENLGAFVFAVKAYNLATGADDELFSRQYRKGKGYEPGFQPESHGGGKAQYQ